MAQGKEWNQEDVIEALRPYFLLGYSVNKACELAQIPQSTVQTWIGNDEELRLKIKAWQGQVSATARKNIVESIYGKNKGKENEIPPDTGLSQWWLERKEKDEFKSSDNDAASLEFIARLLQEAYNSEPLKSDEKETDKTVGSEPVQEQEG